MNTEEKEWNDKIMQKTAEIQKNHPELIEFLNEMPMTIPNKNNPEITIQNLKKYYQSLCDLIDNKK